MSKKLYNCPNCGAPIDGLTCKYCGTTIYDCTELDVSGTNTQYFRFRFGDNFYTGCFYLTNLSIMREPVYSYSGRDILGNLYQRSSTTKTTVSLELTEL